MATNANSNPNPVMLPEIGPDGIARESPVIAYTEKVFSLILLIIVNKKVFDFGKF